MLRPKEAALRADIKPAIGKNGHDLERWQRGEFGFVAGKQDPLAFLFVEAVSNVAVAALAAVDAITVTSELPAPALQRGEAHAQQPSQFASPGTISNAHQGSAKPSGGRRAWSVVPVLSPEGLNLF
jgi:hypothetical protein